MRLIKMLGLAAVAALAAMAFIGASSASAVVLCEEDVEECPEAKIFANGTILHGELLPNTHATLLGGFFGNILCSVSKMLGKAISHTEPTLHGEITSLSFEECEHSGAECTVTNEVSETKPLLALPLLTAAPESTETPYHVVVEKKPGGIKPVLARMECPFVNCAFGAESILFKVLLLKNADGTPKDIEVDVLQALDREGGFCPEESVWHAEYLVDCLKPAGTLKACFPAMKP